ncbi:sigma-E factor negative regulatory protein [Fulvimonas soli]|jgi:sigma-E factor negative regulatory protein RseA|uniref:Sigma-E factor negative regulatory protein RseA n=1 Tax=Fulvimonas soli TaxID=155197 RepID=A0A316IJQ9_9GAMM|nr:sigma-E factor negative regulatory protein [Fulvimonas soli]PWK93036.1 sigma-E factor negative regulatory protein RseA [Fulvimonas soli]TNY26390.1 hypothetical protein BV497_08755 [Fulvimonas soli]
MSELQREHLSAGMDGELSGDELRFLLRRLDHDAAGRQAWSRYHVARDGLRRQLPPLASAGFAERVMEAIGQPAAEGGRVPHWLRWSAGGAIAAGVAAIALMTARPAGEGADLAAGGAAANGAVAAASRPAATPESATPASVPPWLLLNDNKAVRYSQQASAMLGDGYGETVPYGEAAQPYLQRLSPYQLRRLPVNGDGSYLLLIDSPQPVRQEAPRQAAAAR